jgi:hypothetical protein
MTHLSVELPNSLHDSLRELSERDGISVEQFIATAVAEKLAALMTEKYLLDRANRADRSKYEAALAQAPDVDPEPYDMLPS